MLTERPAGAVADPLDDGGGCEDADDGGVSYAEKTYTVGLSQQAVLEQYWRWSVDQGCRRQRLTTPEAMGEDAVGSSLCARKTAAGHTEELTVTFSGDVGSDGGRRYTVNITGDPGHLAC